MVNMGSQTVEVEPELIDRTLACYFPSVRYLSDARVEYTVDGQPIATEIGSCYAIARANFLGKPAWYIRDTGHLNAIEFNICYNQIAFVLLAQCIEVGALAPLCRHLPKEEFLARMLPDIVIHRYSVVFNRPMPTARFRASVGISRVVDKMGKLFLDTECRIALHDGPWCSRGEVKLAVVNTGASAKPHEARVGVMTGEKIAS